MQNNPIKVMDSLDMPYIGSVPQGRLDHGEEQFRKSPISPTLCLDYQKSIPDCLSIGGGGGGIVFGYTHHEAVSLTSLPPFKRNIAIVIALMRTQSPGMKGNLGNCTYFQCLSCTNRSLFFCTLIYICNY